MDYTNQIIQGNCVDIMRQFPPNSVDLVVTSPPYDNLRTYKGYVFHFADIAIELYRVLKVGGVIVWVVGDSVINKSESGNSFRQALYFKDMGFNLHDTMIYQKNSCSYPDKTRYYQTFEYMFILSKGTPKTINLIKDRKNIWMDGRWGKRTRRQKTGELIERTDVQPPVKEFGVRFNIWKINSGAGFSSKSKAAFQHPAIFPEKLAEDHILSWSNPGDIVLDPMCGSGTTLRMAKKNQRNYIGIDVSSEYCELAKKLINGGNENGHETTKTVVQEVPKVVCTEETAVQPDLPLLGS
jgi:site-specific DNA-methyltransferase (adenine-specific)